MHGDLSEVTPELLAAVKHFRAELLAAMGMQEDTAPQVEEAIIPQEAIKVPAWAEIVVADKDGSTGGRMRGPVHMWCWVGGKQWYYVASHPIPRAS